MREPGSVFLYPYRWRGRNEDNPKDRTTTLAIVQNQETKEGATLIHLFLLAITDNPDPDALTVAVPPIEKKRAGLSPNRAAYVVLSEYNYDVLPLSHRYNPNSKTFGTFSRAFTEQVKTAFLSAMRAKAVRRLDRTGE